MKAEGGGGSWHRVEATGFHAKTPADPTRWSTGVAVAELAPFGLLVKYEAEYHGAVAACRVGAGAELEALQGYDWRHRVAVEAAEAGDRGGAARCKGDRLPLGQSK